MSANITEMRYRLVVQRAEDRQLNHIIPDIRALLDEFFSKPNAKDRWKLEQKQMSNLLGVCGQTDSVEAVIGFIEYQIGRDLSKRWPENWAWEGFGERLKEKLRGLQEPAKGIVGDAAGKARYTLDEAAHAQEVERVWMGLVRLYAGHLRRYFVFKESEKGG